MIITLDKIDLLNSFNILFFSPIFEEYFFLTKKNILFYFKSQYKSKINFLFF
jgi:hypothetical protein